MVDRLIDPLICSLNWVLELLFQKSVENLSVESRPCSLEAERGVQRTKCLREEKEKGEIKKIWKEGSQ